MKEMSKFTEPAHIFPSQLTSTEQNVLALCLCELSKAWGKNKKLELVGEVPEELPHIFKFTEEELQKVFGLNKARIDNEYQKKLRPSIQSLIQKDISLLLKGGGFLDTNIISSAEFAKGFGLEIEMPKKLIGILSDYESFAEIEMKMFVQVRSRHGKRIVKELSQWKNRNHNYKYSIEELREILSVKDKYKVFDNFRKNCLDEPIKEILDKSNGVCVLEDKENYPKGYELIKRGRTYSHVVLKMKYSKKAAAKMTETEVEVF